VSNFGLPELRELLSLAKVAPSVLESRSDPFAINHHMVQWALQHNITFIGYSSLGTQWANTPVSINPVFNSSLLKVRPGSKFVQLGCASAGQAVSLCCHRAVHRNADGAARPAGGCAWVFVLTAVLVLTDLACSLERAHDMAGGVQVRPCWRKRYAAHLDPLHVAINLHRAQAIAARHNGKNVAQIVLRWALQLGQVVIPRSANLDHIPSNQQLFDFTLIDAEMQAINALDGTWKTGGLPLPVA
jgi:hypothetical protein